MPGCCAYGCHKRNENKFKMNICPRNKECRALWAVRVKRDNWFQGRIKGSHMGGKIILRPWCIL